MKIKGKPKENERITKGKSKEKTKESQRKTK